MKIKKTVLTILFLLVTTNLEGFTMERIWSAWGDTTGRQFGIGAGGVGDVNGDGYGDFVICSLTRSPLLYYGGNPPDIIPDMILLAPGRGVKGGGDLNGDGYLDFVTGMCSLYVYFGGPGFDAEPDVILPDPLPAEHPDLLYMDRRGRIDIAGDFNGDGYEDIIVFARGDTRVAVLYLGGPSLSTLPSAIFYPPEIHNHTSFAHTVSFGDFNGDGYSDIAVGEDPYDLINHIGYVWVYYGGVYWDDQPDWVLLRDAPRWDSPVFLGDLNRDGYDDLWVCTDGCWAGALFMGSAEPDTTLDFYPVPYGHPIRIGDLNNDGWVDFASTFWNCTKVFLNNGSSDHPFTDPPDFFVRGVNMPNWAGDIDGDGVEDLIIAYSMGDPAERGHVEIWAGERTGIGVQESGKPSEFVFDIYPNPFNSYAVFRYRLNKATDVKISIYDILGRRKGVIYEGRESAGIHRVRWEVPQTFSSGVYFAVIEANNKEAIRGAVLLK